MPELNIKTVGGNGRFEEVIASATPEIQALTRDARALLANVMPGITEVPWARQKIAGYGVGPKKMSEHFCYLAPFKKHLNLGFFLRRRLARSTELAGRRRQGSAAYQDPQRGTTAAARRPSPDRAGQPPPAQAKMSDTNFERVAAAIAAYDGKRSDSLESVASQVDATPEVLQSLCDFTCSEESRIQSAASWLLRRYSQAGATLSPKQTERLLSVLTRDCHWEARLHVLQMMGDLALPLACVKKLWRALAEQTKDNNKFIRAWSCYGLAVIADQHPLYQERALTLLAAGEQNEAASVRARIRRIRKAFKWAV